jgi:hypothetical protein
LGAHVPYLTQFDPATAYAPPANKPKNAGDNVKKAFVLLSCLLAGCVYALGMPEKLQPLKGQNIRVAIERLGYPTEQREVLGDTVYTWSTLGPVVANSFMVGQLYCVIEVGTDSAGTIKEAHFHGNAGCGPYARALSR